MRINNKLRRYNKFKTNQSIYHSYNSTPASKPQDNEHIIEKKQKKRTYWDKLSKKRRALYYFLTVVLTIGFWVIVFNL